MTAVLKHLKSNHAPTVEHPSGFTVAPAVQAIVVDGIPIVDPQFASIIRNNAVSVMAPAEESHSC
jgi:hypothetical protein